MNGSNLYSSNAQCWVALPYYRFPCAFLLPTPTQFLRKRCRRITMASIVLVDDGSLPPGPCINLQPPDDTKVMHTYGRKVVFGFPLTAEWFNFRYFHDLDLTALDKDAIKEKKHVYKDRLITHILNVCDRMEGRVCRSLPTSVETSTVSSCWFIIIGNPGRRPSKEDVKKLRKTLWLYGITERPNWYPENWSEQVITLFLSIFDRICS